MFPEVEYWNCEVRMSKPALYEVLYAVILHHGAITDTLSIGCSEFTKKQNAYHMVELRIRLPKGKRESFEKMSGLKLTIPPKVSLKEKVLQESR